MRYYVYDYEQQIVAIFDCATKEEACDRVVESFPEHEVCDWVSYEAWETEAQAIERLRNEYIEKIGHDPFEDGEDLNSVAQILKEWKEETCES